MILFSTESSPVIDESGKAIVNGIKSVSQVIEEGRNFFKHHERYDITSDRIPYHSGLAAQYGTLTSDTIKAMDNKLKVSCLFVCFYQLYNYTVSKQKFVALF